MFFSWQLLFFGRSYLIDPPVQIYSGIHVAEFARDGGDAADQLPVHQDNQLAREAEVDG